MSNTPQQRSPDAKDPTPPTRRYTGDPLLDGGLVSPPSAPVIDYTPISPPTATTRKPIVIWTGDGGSGIDPPARASSTPIAAQSAAAKANESAEVVNARQRADAQSSAVQAERKWLQDVSQGQDHYARNNRIRLVSTLADNMPDTAEGKINTTRETVTFDLTPIMSESKSVIYAEIADIRQAASILVFGGSPSRKWSINATFMSRTEEEANATWKNIQLLRSWTVPDKNYRYGFDRETPQVLRLYGYGRTWQGIPVVIQSLNIEYPDDVDYIPAATALDNVVTNGSGQGVTKYEYGSLVPVIQKVSIQITELRTPSELFKDFELEQFKLGILPRW